MDAELVIGCLIWVAIAVTFIVFYEPLDRLRHQLADRARARLERRWPTDDDKDK